MQMAEAVSRTAGSVLYVSGEESPQQIKLRSERLGISGDGIHLLDTGNTEKVLAAAETLMPALVVVDSAQTLRTEGLSGSPGTVSQVRESVSRIAEQAKKLPCAVFVVSHVTKEGLVAGPKVVEHLVDAVLMMEGDNHAGFRLLRSLKNRFGPTGELGIFEMESRGLAPVTKTGSFFRPVCRGASSGAATVITCEGTRSYLVEIQALVTQSPYQIPNRKVTGADPNRVALQLALLGKLGLSLMQRDVFINVAGGLRLNETAVDLGVMMAVASSLTDTPLPQQVAFIGEVGLRGELRPVHNFNARIREGVQNGITSFAVPENNKTEQKDSSDIHLMFFSEFREVLSHFLETVV
jgi:DNA repair protein RadA/Sms